MFDFTSSSRFKLGYHFLPQALLCPPTILYAYLVIDLLTLTVCEQPVLFVVEVLLPSMGQDTRALTALLDKLGIWNRIPAQNPRHGVVVWGLRSDMFYSLLQKWGRGRGLVNFIRKGLKPLDQ